MSSQKKGQAVAILPAPVDSVETLLKIAKGGAEEFAVTPAERVIAELAAKIRKIVTDEALAGASKFFPIAPGSETPAFFLVLSGSLTNVVVGSTMNLIAAVAAAPTPEKKAEEFLKLLGYLGLVLHIGPVYVVREATGIVGLAHPGPMNRLADLASGSRIVTQAGELVVTPLAPPQPPQPQQQK